MFILSIVFDDWSSLKDLRYFNFKPSLMLGHYCTFVAPPFVTDDSSAHHEELRLNANRNPNPKVGTKVQYIRCWYPWHVLRIGNPSDHMLKVRVWITNLLHVIYDPEWILMISQCFFNLKKSAFLPAKRNFPNLFSVLVFHIAKLYKVANWNGFT